MKLFTIGYQHATQGELVGRLKDAGVKVVLDVRAVAASRRPGFSKRILAAGLGEVGIEYIHLKGLGTPAAGRAAARAGRVGEMKAMYANYLAQEPAAETDLAQAGEIASVRPAALLCLEGEASICHRSLVAARLKERLGFEVVDL